MIKKKILGIILLSLSNLSLYQSVLAEENVSFACMDPDIVNTLVGNAWEGVPIITLDWPDQFPNLALPEQFSLIGSRTNQHSVTVALKSKLSANESRNSLELALKGNDWSIPEPIHMQPGGFQSRNMPNPNNVVRFCHNDHGYLNAIFKNGPDLTSYLLLMTTKNQNSDGCNMQQGISPAYNHMQIYKIIPTLTLPDDAVNTVSMGSSGGGDSYSTNANFKTKLSAVALVNFFGTQLQDQDWVEDSQWMGSKIFGSAWLSKDGKHTGLLSIVAVNEGDYKVVLSVSKL